MALENMNSQKPINLHVSSGEGDANFRILSEKTSSAMFIFKGVKFIYVNPATELLTGFSSSELYGKNIYDVFSSDAKKIIPISRSTKKAATTRPSHGEFRITTKTNEDRWVNLTVARIEYDRKPFLLGTAFDITDSKRAEVLQDAVYRIAQAADRSKRLDDLFPAVHAIIAEVMNSDNFYIALYDRETNLLSFPYFVDEVDTPPEPSHPGKGLTEYILRTGKSLLVDLATHDDLIDRGEIELVGVPSPIWLGVPLIVDNKVIGAMVVQHYSNPNAYREREKRILEFVSSQVAMVINQKRSEDALRASEERYHRRADELAALYETARDLSTHKNLDILLNLVADRVTSLIGSPGCSIYLFDKVRQDLEIVVSRGFPDIVGKRVQLGEGIAGEVARTRQPIVVGNYRKWGKKSKQFENLPATAVLEVPMMFSGDLVGVLTVFELENATNLLVRKYNQKDIDLLKVFGGTVAVAVHNARLFDDTQQRLLELEALYQTSLAATQIFSTHAVAQRIVDTLEVRMNWKRGSIWLVDKLHQNISLLAQSTSRSKTNSPVDPGTLIPATMGFNEGTVGQVCSNGKAVRTGNVSRTPSNTEFRDIDTRSELCVPLQVGGKIIGCINVESNKANDFSEHDERILSTIAAQAATAIDNASLYQEAIHASERRSILHQASQEIARANQDPEQLFASVHHAAVQLMEADTFVISLFDAEKKEINGVYLIDLGERHPNINIRAGQGISGRILKTGKSILVQDFSKSSLGINPLIFGKRGMTRSVLAVPMRSGEKTIGMISTQSYKPNIYTDDDAVILEMLASHAGAAIENARLFAETSKRLTELELLYQASLSAIQIQSLEAVAQKIVDALESLLNWDGSIWIVESHRPIMVAHSEMGMSGEVLTSELKRISNLVTTLDDGIVGWVCKSGNVVRTGDVRTEPHAIIDKEDIRSELCVPLKTGGETIGCINVESKYSAAFSEHDERLLITLANQAVVAIENARLFEETRQRGIRQAALNEIIMVSARAGADLDEILSTTLDQTLKAFGLDMGTIWLSWSSRGVQRMASKNIPEPVNTLIADTVLTKSKSLTKTLSVDDWRVEDQYQYSDQFISEDILSTMIVPLLTDEKQIGGLTIASRTSRHWTEEEVALGEAIGREVGSAAERAKLFDETTFRLDELEAVNKLSTALRLAQTLDEMLPQLVDETLKSLGVEAGGIWLYDPERDKLRQVIGRGWCTQLAQIELDNGEGMPGNAFSTGDIFFSQDVARDKLTSDTMRKFVPPGWSGICLPIHSEQKPIGVLMASTTLPREFTSENARLLVTLTEIAGNAIHRTRLNEQLMKHAAELEVRVTNRTAELQSALQKAQTADRLKSEFIANVNHELRTPLTNLVLYYQMLRAQPNVKTEERLDVIGRELQRLRNLIEDLLNLSRFEFGQISLRPVPCDLNGLIQTLVNDRRSMAEEKGLSLELELEKGLSPILLDEPTIIQAVSNLLTNAMNYTPRGGTVMVITLTTKFADEQWTGFRVRDNGRGINEEDMPHLFERFYRGKAGRESGAPGTGLGLAIVKQVVDHHMGRIEVENCVGGSGTVFTIWLPMNIKQETK